MKVKENYKAPEFARLIEREGDELELKLGLGSDPLQEAMVALSNTTGGHIFVGVADDGRVQGRRLDQGVEDKIHESALAVRDVGRRDVTGKMPQDGTNGRNRAPWTFPGSGC
jgi:predicted HTH transcriptional regulator